MVDLYGMFFFIQFALAVGITLFKTYNVMRLWSKDGPVYELPMSFILFIGFLIVYAVGFISFLVNFEEPLFLALFKMESLLFMGLNVLYFIIELFRFMTSKYMKDTVTARNARREYYAE